MRYFRFVFCIMMCMALLAGCAKPVPSEQPGTSAPTEDSVQVPTSGSVTLPAQTEPASEDMTQIPRQNTLQSGNPQTLSDWVFTNYEQTFSWRDSVNNFCSVTITLPALAPVTDFAIRFNEEIWELGSAYVEEAVQCRKQETSNILSRVTYEAYLHDEILSIVLIENTTFDYTAYRSWSFDLEDQNNCSNQCLHWLQEVSTGNFRCYGFESISDIKNNRYPFGYLLFLAPLVGLEPTTCGLTVRRSTD